MMTKYWHMPKHVRTVRRGAAWWYADRNAIELYVEPFGGIVKVRLKLSDLREFVQRADAEANRK